MIVTEWAQRTIQPSASQSRLARGSFEASNSAVSRPAFLDLKSTPNRVHSVVPPYMAHAVVPFAESDGIRST